MSRAQAERETRPSEVWTSADLARDPHADAAKAEKVRRMFGAIAERYDLNNRLHSFGRDQAWRRRAVGMAAVRPGEDVLDVACGTGDLARLFARMTDARSVVGADFTDEMLEIARRRVEERDGERVRYVNADATDLPFEGGSFDALSIAFGIRNVTDPAKALSEFRRVLRPGGRLVVLEFATPPSPLVRWLNGVYCKRVMPVTATLISGDRTGAYRYLPRSIETFLQPEQMLNALRQAGFGETSAKPMTLGVCVCYRGVVPG